MYCDVCAADGDAGDRAAVYGKVDTQDSSLRKDDTLPS